MPSGRYFEWCLGHWNWASPCVPPKRGSLVRAREVEGVDRLLPANQNDLLVPVDLHPVGRRNRVARVAADQTPGPGRHRRHREGHLAGHPEPAPAPRAWRSPSPWRTGVGRSESAALVARGDPARGPRRASACSSGRVHQHRSDHHGTGPQGDAQVGGDPEPAPEPRIARLVGRPAAAARARSARARRRSASKQGHDGELEQKIGEAAKVSTSAAASATPLSEERRASASRTGRCTAPSSPARGCGRRARALSARSVVRSAATASPPPKRRPVRCTAFTTAATVFESQ